MSSPKGSLVAWTWLWAAVPWLLGKHSDHQQGWLRLKANTGSYSLPPKIKFCFTGAGVKPEKVSLDEKSDILSHHVPLQLSACRTEVGPLVPQLCC